ncbi:MAG: hypothetical protein COU46_01260 [Candidatus Niyogibacteria bacterium CG10_big_fil_rev_8_21_14_0_10_42_19]|uniref:DUF7768 domain-containing protein n=1 Tax=Candidatus Niyogibacteria bacterium CG10_big_fil_rev_8_21_14_0_10_42_19 TaxID=1974725 RepID=A0A2H0THN4_9BACT|nr:MAG: hypothetical protein COU46_01260 [Candidatus Niyogibacteria bacterium CG10_big_fil_rev_8_21_14_0_10_42_19]
MKTCPENKNETAIWEVELLSNSEDFKYRECFNILFKGSLGRVFEATELIGGDQLKSILTIGSLMIKTTRVTNDLTVIGRKMIDLTLKNNAITKMCECRSKKYSLEDLKKTNYCSRCGQDIKKLFGYFSGFNLRKREKIFICSKIGASFKQGLKKNIDKTKLYARWALLNGFDPESTGFYYCEFLDDFSPEERKQGQMMGQARMTDCRAILVVIEKNDAKASPGMASDIKKAAKLGLKFVFKTHEEITDWIKLYDPCAVPLQKKFPDFF